MGAPGKQSRVPHPREARLLARPPGVAEPPPSRSVWTPARPASVNGTFFSSSGCYLGGSGLGRGRVLWLVEDNPLGQGWGWETDFFGLPYSPYVRQARGLGLPFAVPCPGAGSCLPSSPPLLPILPEKLRLGLAAQRVLRWGVEGEMGWSLGLGGSQSSQVRQEFSVAPHVSHASFHFPSPPPAVRGPSRPPGSTITCPSAPYHLLKISPIPSCSFSVLMSVPSTLTPPQQKQIKTKTENIRVNWGAERPAGPPPPA